MSSSIEAEPERKAASHASSHFIKTIQFDDWKSLGHAVALSLSPRRTVLVGRNGGGKSLLLEGIRDAVYSATGLAPQTAQPIRKFTLGIASLANPERVEFWYTWEVAQANQGPRRSTRVDDRSSRAQRCWDAGSNQLLWRIDESGLAYFYPGTPKEKRVHFINASSLAGQDVPDDYRGEPPGQSLAIVVECMTDLRSVAAVIPVRGCWRKPALVLRDDEYLSVHQLVERLHVSSPDTLTDRLAALSQDASNVFEEINAVGVRLGIWRKLAIEKYTKPQGRESDVVVAATVDGINLGLVSDGTLRLLKILLELVQGAYHRSPLLIDEPELGIHPGLLGRLLAEFDAYGAGRQLIIATHSPQVVSWAKPEELRLVERKDERTMVRSLTKEQSARVYDYLQDQGNLGEFVYDGGLDE